MRIKSLNKYKHENFWDFLQISFVVIVVVFAFSYEILLFCFTLIEGEQSNWGSSPALCHPCNTVFLIINIAINIINMLLATTYFMNLVAFLYLFGCFSFMAKIRLT